MTLRGMAAVSATRVPAFKNFLRVMDICFSLNFSADVGSVPGGFWWVPLIYDAPESIIFLENIQYVIFRRYLQDFCGIAGHIHILRGAALMTLSRRWLISSRRSSQPSPGDMESVPPPSGGG